MLQKLTLVSVLCALAATAGTVPNAPVYRFTLAQPASVNGAVLQPGNYKVAVHEAKAIVTSEEGRVVEAPVKVEAAPSKFATTAVTIEVRDGKPVLVELDLGGRKTKLLFAQ